MHPTHNIIFMDSMRRLQIRAAIELLASLYSDILSTVEDPKRLEKKETDSNKLAFLVCGGKESEV